MRKWQLKVGFLLFSLWLAGCGASGVVDFDGATDDDGADGSGADDGGVDDGGVDGVDAGDEDVRDGDTGDGDGDVGDPCADHCANQVQDCGEAGLDCGGECAACPDNCRDNVCDSAEDCGLCPEDCCPCPSVAVLVDDQLTSAATCSGARNGGSFSDAGWSSSSWDSRIVYDFGQPLDCAALRIDAHPFSPPTQYVHNNGGYYLHPLSVYQGSHGTPWTGAGNHEAEIRLQASSDGTFRDKKIKLKTSTGTGADGWGGGTPGEVYTKTAWNWNLDHVYRFCLDWNGQEVRLFVDGNQETQAALSYAPEGSPRPALRYLFVGRDKNTAGGWLDGATYSNLRIVAGGRCPNPSR